MNDFEQAMAPKSDQINASDLIGGDMIVTITGVKVTPGTEQPVSISIKESRKVWRPCKSTGRVMMKAWGTDTSKYIGKSVQLYLDPDVKWGGMKVGGIRIRAISHIAEDMSIVLAESKQVRKLVTVKRIVLSGATNQEPAKYDATKALSRAKEQAAHGIDAFRAWFNTDDGKDCRATGALTQNAMLELRAIAEKADAAKSEDPFGLPPIDDTRHANVLTDDELRAQAEAEAEFAAQRAREMAAE